MGQSKLEKRFTEPPNWLWGHFKGARGESLRYGQLTNHKTPRAHIVYLMGLSEFSEKTFELAHDFNNMACNFSVFDRHGQGKSPRFLKDAHKQHSDGTAADIEDIVRFCEKNIPAGEPIVLLGHSTGGLLAIEAIAKRPDLFKGAILNAPLIGFETPPVKNRERFWATIPLPDWVEEQYIPGGRPFTSRKDSPMKPEDFSSDPARNKLDDLWRENNPELQTGSPTIGWVQNMCKTIMHLRKNGFAEKIKTPVLIFTGGKDKLVNNDHIRKFADRLPNAEIYNFPDGKHELLIEKDSIRSVLMTKANAFLRNKL